MRPERRLQDERSQLNTIVDDGRESAAVASRIMPVEKKLTLEPFANKMQGAMRIHISTRKPTRLT